MMKNHRLLVIAWLVLGVLFITTGVVFALGVGAVNQGADSAAEGDFSAVSGGKNNNIPDSGDFAAIGGGENNVAQGLHSTIGGGLDNRASATVATVGGGEKNTASGTSSTASGGIANTASGLSSTIGGGHQNTASGERSTIGGGRLNTASGFKSTIAGGRLNAASGNESAIGGGRLNTAGGINSTVPGGLENSALGDFSFAAGRNAQANHTGTFVWADAQGGSDNPVDFSSTGENQFLIRASGGVGIGTNSPNQLMVVGDSFASPLPGNRITIGNTGTPGPEGRSGLNLGEDQDQRAFILWHNDENYLQLGVRNGNIQENDALVIKDRRVGVGTVTPRERLHVNGNVRASRFLTTSSRELKANIQTIEGALEKVQGLRGVAYEWKADGQHDIGLIAEEVGKVVPEVVVYEENGEDATAVDYARLVPVLIEAVKEQQQLLEDKDTQIAALKGGSHELEARIEALEHAMGVEVTDVQTKPLPFRVPVMWTLAGGLGLLLVLPRLALGYRRARRDE